MKNSRRRNEHQLRINPINCHAHGLCADLLPEMVTLDEWGVGCQESASGCDLAIAYSLERS